MPSRQPRPTPSGNLFPPPRLRRLFGVGICSLLLGVMGDSASLGQDPDSPPPRQAVVAADQEWISLDPEGARATFELPFPSAYVEKSIEPIKGRPRLTVRTYQAISENQRNAFLVSYHDLHDTPNTRKTIDETLLGAIGGSVFMVDGELIGDPKVRNQQGAAGREFRYQFSNKQGTSEVRSRVLLIKNRVYQLTAIMEKDAFDEGAVNRFLDSFKLKTEKSDSP